MREYEFRGFDTVSNKWVYGDLLHIGKNLYISNENFNGKVKKETVGQYTGFKDANKTKIYECDIIRSYDFAYERTGGRKESREIIGKVVFRHGEWCLVEIKTNYAYNLFELYMEDMELEIIGDIHKNKELLKGVE